MCITKHLLLLFEQFENIYFFSFGLLISVKNSHILYE
jgi:hypothetical protein